MAGHSKWATTKHHKAAQDAKRGKLFANLIKKIEVAARLGGGDPAGNPALYDAIQKAKKNSVPNDNIDRAVKRGSGEGSDSVEYVEITYEAYGPAGVAILIEVLTDNRNRSASDIKVAVTRNGGTIADVGSVTRMFDRKGVVEVSKKQSSGGVTEDDLLEATLDAGPEDILDAGETFKIISEPSQLVESARPCSCGTTTSRRTRVPSPVRATRNRGRGRRETVQAVGRDRDVDDVQNVFSNETCRTRSGETRGLR